MTITIRKSTLLFGAIYILFIVAAAMIISLEVSAARQLDDFYGRQSLSDSLKRGGKGLLELITIGLYDGQERELRELDDLKTSAEAMQRRAQLLAWALFAGAATLLGSLVALNRSRGVEGARRVAVHFLLVSLIFFVIGISTPVLSILVSRDAPAIDTVVLKFESKGVLSAIASLFSQGNIFVGALITLFSVVVPLVKLVAAVVLVTSSSQGQRARINGFLKAIGKWSMADVFVVAILLVFFATERDDYTSSWLGLGIYFFAWYCLISLTTTYVLSRLIKAPAEAPAALPQPQD